MMTVASPSLLATRVSSFPPVVGAAPHILILGTMPGAASLAAGQYYAHPQNAFWKIMAAITGVSVSASYEQRVLGVQRAGIALWDVLASCVRPGSMDADIELSSAQPNAIAALLARQPTIRRIGFNGSAAEKLFKRHVAPELALSAIDYWRLPSTSPAHARLSLEAKLTVWRQAVMPPA